MEITLESLNNNHDISYKYYKNLSCKGFTKLMKLVILIPKYPKLFQEIEKLLKKNPKEINKQNNDGCTALILAVIYSKTDSSNETVKMLLNHPQILLTNCVELLIDNNLIHLMSIIPDYKIDKSLFGKYHNIYEILYSKYTKNNLGSRMLNNKEYSDIIIT